MNDDPPRIRVVCDNCDGDGHLGVPTAALIDGVARTLVTPRVCEWCDGEGHRAGFHPPA